MVRSLLAPGALFLFEIGYGQSEAVEVEIRCRRDWRFGGLDPDLDGIPRVAIARKSKVQSLVRFRPAPT